MEELYLSRLEIRRSAHARLGFSSGQALMVNDQHNEFIRGAAREVAQACPWVNTKRSTRPSVGIDQRFVNYPTGATAGSIIQIGVWDAGASQYCVLRRGVIPVQLDDEPIVDEGEPASVAARGIPTLYEVRNQIEIYPRPDQEYELKIDYVLTVDLSGDDVVSIVDAEAVILLVCAEIYAFQGDVEQARFYRAKYDAQIRALATGQRHDLTMSKRGSYERRLAGAKNPLGDYEPNSGAWPSRTPT